MSAVWQAALNGKHTEAHHWSWWISASLHSSWARVLPSYRVIVGYNQRSCWGCRWCGVAEILPNFLCNLHGSYLLIILECLFFPRNNHIQDSPSLLFSSSCTSWAQQSVDFLLLIVGSCSTEGFSAQGDMWDSCTYFLKLSYSSWVVPNFLCNWYTKWFCNVCIHQRCH